MNGAQTVLDDLRARGVELAVGDEGLTYRAPKGSIPVELRGRVLDCRSEIAELLLAERGARLWRQVEDLRRRSRSYASYGLGDEADRLWAESEAIMEGPILQVADRLIALWESRVAAKAPPE